MCAYPIKTHSINGEFFFEGHNVQSIPSIASNQKKKNQQTVHGQTLDIAVNKAKISDYKYFRLSKCVKREIIYSN